MTYRLANPTKVGFLIGTLNNLRVKLVLGYWRMMRLNYIFRVAFRHLINIHVGEGDVESVHPDLLY